MKKLLLPFILFILINKTPAQVVFCPPGAEWHYAFLWPFYWNTENTTINYIGDTLIGSENIKILSSSKFYKRQNCFFASRTLIRQRGDTIFMNNNKTLNSWQILYNFAALQGQSWQTSFINAVNSPVTYTVSVDSVSTVSVNNFSLKKLYVKYLTNATNSIYAEAATITERFGCNKYLYNYTTAPCSSDADLFRNFLCYKDDAFGTKQFSDTACNYSDAVGIAELKFKDGEIAIFPNPTSGIFTIESATSEMAAISIHNAFGELVYTQKNLNSNTQIDLSFLPQGIYYLSAESDKIKKTIKLVKN